MSGTDLFAGVLALIALPFYVYLFMGVECGGCGKRARDWGNNGLGWLCRKCGWYCGP